MEVVAGVSDWKELGLQLGITSVKINQLMEDAGDTEHCREEMMLEWLKDDKTASWEKLSTALELMGNEAEVQIIKELICHHLPEPEGQDCPKSVADNMLPCFVIVTLNLWITNINCNTSV